MNTPTKSKDTIAALATPAGIGGISVIRISGDLAFPLVETVFEGSTAIQDALSHTIHYGKIIDPDSTSVIDTVLVSLFRGPHSYTGEDVVEISSHGGYYVIQKILEVLLTQGAVTAQPGEFTLRAFINGKMDLIQAEAVADIIHSRSDKAHKASIEQLSGRLSSHIAELRQQLLNICSIIELELDFAQEGIELVSAEESINKIESIERKISFMIDSYKSGKIVREGVKVAIAGRPNVGKSSLLNVLLEEERAIVSEIPGTTRDVIEESIIFNGLEFVFTDTAGLRESFDIIEKEGIRRTIQKLQNADIALIIVDSSIPSTKEDELLYGEISSSLKEGVHPIFVINKSDIINPRFDIASVMNKPNIKISCKTKEGIEELKRILFETMIPQYDSISSSVIITNVRHRDALISSMHSLKRAKLSLSKGMSQDFIAVDLRDALNYLGEIIGLTTPDDILNNIFSKFCIGK